MSISLIQSSFTGGEWAPTLHYRFGHAQYASACKTLLNFYPHPHGPVSNRPGLEYIGAVKTASETIRLWPFQFNVTQSYMLEFGNGYVRFYKDGGRITQTKTVSGAADNGSGAIRLTVTGHGFADGCRVTVASVGGVPNATGTWVIDYVGADTFDLVGSTWGGSYTSGGTATFLEVPTPYAEADLPTLKFEQSADTLYIFHPSHQRRKLTRSSHYHWTLAAITSGASIAAPTGLSCSGTGKHYAVTALTADGIESVPSSTEVGAGGNTLTWTAVSGADEYRVYELIDGIYKYIGKAGTNSYAVPSSYTPDEAISAPKARDPFSGSGNYPGCGAIFDQRMTLARTDTDPQGIWGTVVGDYENHNVSSPLRDDDAFYRSIDSRQVNEIRWMADLNELIVGTSGGIHRVFPGAASDTITPSSINRRRASEWGVSHHQPLLVGNSLLFVDFQERTVLDLFSQIDAEGRDGYAGNDLTLLANHLFTEATVADWCYSQDGDSLIWIVRSDGFMVGMTYKREHQIYGWHRHQTDGYFENVACLKNTDGTSEIWVCVRRTVNGSTVRHIERLHSRDFTDVEDAFFVDSGLTYDGSVAATLTPGTGATVVGTEGVSFTAGASSFSAGDVGREIHYRYANGTDLNGHVLYSTAKAEITAYVSGTEVEATIALAWPSTAVIASGDWRLSVAGVSGLGHLEGATVVALADGNVVENLTVSSAAVTLPFPASKIHVGLSYVCDLETLGFVYETRNGTMVDKIRQTKRMVLVFEKTRECLAGPDVNHLDEVFLRDQEQYGEPNRLFYGQKPVYVDPGDETRVGRCMVRVTKPLPCTISAIMPAMVQGRQ